MNKFYINQLINNKLLIWRRLFICLIATSLLLASSVQAQSWLITAETWEVPRSGLRLVEIKPLSNAVNALNQLPDASLNVIYPASESGILWANELRDWLVSLGIPSERIQLSDGLVDDFSLKLSLLK